MIHQLLGWLEHVGDVLRAVTYVLKNLTLLIAAIAGLTVSVRVLLRVVRPAAPVRAKQGRKVLQDGKRCGRRRPRSNNQT